MEHNAKGWAHKRARDPLTVAQGAPENHSALVSSGTAANRSASRPKSATEKIGASGSWLIATITLESFMPARCWMAPEMPAAIYNVGATILPVWPTCQSLGA